MNADRFSGSAAVVLLALAAAFGSSARAAEPIAIAPYHIDPSGWFIVEVTINDAGPFPFIIDTGATRSIVFASLAARMAFPGSELPPQRVIGITSSALHPTFIVGELAIGEAKMSPLVTVVLEDWRPGLRAPLGVVGLDFLTRFRIEFDAGAGEMRLYEPGAARGLDMRRWRRVPLQRDDFGLNSGEMFVLAGLVDRKPADFMLDLGASVTIVNSHVFEQRDTRRPRSAAGFQRDRYAARIIDALEESAAGVRVIVRDLQAGASVWNDLDIVVHNASVFEELGRAAEPFGLFGADMLTGRSFVLDFANDLLLVSRSGTRERGSRSPETLYQFCTSTHDCR
jgi:predicted aspartyl protease